MIGWKYYPNFRGLCELEQSQFCTFSEDGIGHDLPICKNCPYLRELESDSSDDNNDDD